MSPNINARAKSRVKGERVVDVLRLAVVDQVAGVVVARGHTGGGEWFIDDHVVARIVDVIVIIIVVPDLEVVKLGLVPAESERSPAAAAGQYRYRNRTYSPTLGRFLQRDPNATAMPQLLSMAHSGRAMDFDSDSLDAQSHYGDGMSLLSIAQSNLAGLQTCAWREANLTAPASVPVADPIRR